MLSRRLNDTCPVPFVSSAAAAAASSAAAAVTGGVMGSKSCDQTSSPLSPYVKCSSVPSRVQSIATSRALLLPLPLSGPAADSAGSDSAVIDAARASITWRKFAKKPLSWRRTSTRSATERSSAASTFARTLSHAPGTEAMALLPPPPPPPPELLIAATSASSAPSKKRRSRGEQRVGSVFPTTIGARL